MALKFCFGQYGEGVDCECCGDWWRCRDSREKKRRVDELERAELRRKARAEEKAMQKEIEDSNCFGNKYMSQRNCMTCGKQKPCYDEYHQQFI